MLFKNRPFPSLLPPVPTPTLSPGVQTHQAGTGKGGRELEKGGGLLRDGGEVGGGGLKWQSLIPHQRWVNAKRRCAAWSNNMREREGGAPLKAHHVPAILSLPAPHSSLIHKTLLNIEPLSINTHTQTSPALPYSSLRPEPPPLLWANTTGQGTGRKKEERKEHTYIHAGRQRGNQRKRKKVVAA